MKAEAGIIGEGDIAAGFERGEAGTIGAEEEFMLLRLGTRELVPDAEKVLSRVEGQDRFTGELPASQIEARTTPCRSVPELMDQLARARRDLASAADGLMELASAGTHPLAPPEGELSRDSRYKASIRQYGSAVLRRQLVFAFQVHVAAGSPACSLAVYNSLRSYLPTIAALAANAPFFDGKATGLASIRPQIGLLLPRQGVPPAFGDWGEFTRALEWGQSTGFLVHPGNWWWELRPRPDLGTLEVRVPDAQTTLREAAGVAALTHCLVMWLARRHADGETLPVHPSWQIAENRWIAARDGVEAELADLDTGEQRPLQKILETLLVELDPVAEALGCSSELASAIDLADVNGAIRQRQAADEHGLSELPGWLSGRFLAED